MFAQAAEGPDQHLSEPTEEGPQTTTATWTSSALTGSLQWITQVYVSLLWPDSVTLRVIQVFPVVLLSPAVSQLKYHLQKKHSAVYQLVVQP